MKRFTIYWFNCRFIFKEEEFLKKGIAKIAALKPKPDILIVEKSVSRLAQDFLLEHGITLVYNVKLVGRIAIMGEAKHD